jgi:hypothetical protein
MEGIMNLFISWSGEKSYAVAEALRSWIPKVIQAIKPFLSKKDINKGTQWREEISSKLDDAHAGIFCLTNDNLTSPWLNFEAGAISKAGGDRTYVCTYLFEINSTDVIEPLAQFQHTLANKEETRSLIKTLNRALQDNGLQGFLEERTLDEIFETFWPQLEESLKGILTAYKNSEPQSPKRSERDILEEILSLVREPSKQTFVTYQPTPFPWSDQYTLAQFTTPPSASFDSDESQKIRKAISEFESTEARKRALEILMDWSERQKKARPAGEEK